MSLQILISYPEVIPPIERPPIFRVKHWVEQTDNERPYGRPEVEPTFPAHYSIFDERWQFRVGHMNPKFAPEKKTSIYDWETWMTNEQGFGKPGDPRRNYFEMKNLTAKYPKVENLLGGGTIFTGYVEGKNVVVLPLDFRMTPPSAAWFELHPWYRVPAIIASKTPFRFKQGIQPDGSVETFYHPMIMDTKRFPKITIPASKVQRWTATQLPDPLKIYL